MERTRKIIIIGGGAAGIMASIAAARKLGRGNGILVLERMRRVGKKLLATGNGRCNLTNLDPDPGHYHGAHPGFARDARQQFDVRQTLAFFEELGLLTRAEEDGKVFPRCDQASSVLDVLRYEMEQLGVEVICEVNVQKIQREEGGLRCLATDGRVFSGERVIVAAGGKSSPNLGSNGGGFKIAEALGHRLEKPFPALVQVKLDAPFLKHLQGVRIQAEAAVLAAGQPSGKEKGELLFTDYGLSGPPILQLSRIVSGQAENGRGLAIRLDLFPDIGEEDLAGLIARRIAANPRKPTDFSFVGLLHKRLIPILLKEAGIEDQRAGCGALSGAAIRRIAARLKDWRLRCAGTQSWMSSQVTAGGVDVRQVDRRTMESKIVPGVFFAGEVLDIDGDSGGYNLQWAWSSGHAAGVHAAG